MAKGFKDEDGKFHPTERTNGMSSSQVLRKNQANENVDNNNAMQLKIKKLQKENWTQNELDEALILLNSKIDEKRKVKGESDISFRVKGIFSEFSSDRSRDPRFTGINIKFEFPSNQTKKLIASNLSRLDEVATWASEILDSNVGSNDRNEQSKQERVKKSDAFAKSLSPNLESFSDASGITGTIKNVGFTITDNEIRLGVFNDKQKEKILKAVVKILEEDE